MLLCCAKHTRITATWILYAAESLYNVRNELLIVGDLNFNMLNNDCSVPDVNLTEFCDRFCMTNTIKELTRVTTTSSSLIDVVPSSNLECFALSGTMKLVIIGHDLIYTICKQKLPRPPPRLIEYRSMRNFHEERYQTDLNNVPWDSAYVYNDVEDIWDHWYK